MQDNRSQIAFSLSLYKTLSIRLTAVLLILVVGFSGRAMAANSCEQIFATVGDNLVDWTRAQLHEIAQTKNIESFKKSRDRFSDALTLRIQQMRSPEEILKLTDFYLKQFHDENQQGVHFGAVTENSTHILTLARQMSEVGSVEQKQSFHQLVEVLAPQKIHIYMDEISLALDPNYDYAGGLSKTTEMINMRPYYNPKYFTEAFGTLTGGRRNQIHQELQQKWLEESATQKSGGEKNRKRNYELVDRYLDHWKLQALAQHLYKPEITKEEAVQIIDQYFVNRFGAMRRDAYSFEKVLAVAERIQANAKDFLGQKGVNLMLYGSFVNGKANLETSDVDIHPSNELLLKHTRKFQWVMRSKVNARMGKPFTYALDRSLQKAQKETSEIMDRENSDNIFEVFSDFNGRAAKFELNIYGEYNPLVIKILRDQIQLLIYDSLTGKTKEIGLTGLL